MNPVSILYIAFASIAFFSGCMQLFLSFRNKKDVDFLACAVLSLFFFISLCIDALISISSGSTVSLTDLLRYQLIFYIAVAICLLGTAYHLLKIRWRSFYLLNFAFLGLLLLVSLIIPDRILFEASGVNFHLPEVHANNMPMMNRGYTIWRGLMDLNILVLSLSVILFLWKGTTYITYKTRVLLFAATGIILLSSFLDQLTDLGSINITYLLPFGLFIFYMIIIFIPVINFTKDKVDQINLIQKEQKWCSLIYQSDIVIVSLNRMGHVEFVSPYFYKLTGYSAEEVIGKDWFEFFIPPKDFYNVQGAFIEVLENNFHPQYYNPILTKSKEEKLMRWFNIRSHNEQGITTGSVSIGIDVTEEMKENEALSKKLKDAEELIAALTKKKG